LTGGGRRALYVQNELEMEKKGKTNEKQRRAIGGGRRKKQISRVAERVSLQKKKVLTDFKKKKGRPLKTRPFL